MASAAIEKKPRPPQHPKHITSATGAILWTWQGDPFGNSQPSQASITPTISNARIGATAQGYTYNQRFAGQTYDKETGLYYNYFRHYDPATGRYVEADPIGLEGGWNRYAYVEGNPLGAVDPRGLKGSSGPSFWGDQFNPSGKADGFRNYKSYFDQRFPKTVAGARREFQNRIKSKICKDPGTTPVRYVMDPLDKAEDDIDIKPDMRRFGDNPQSWYEREVKIGKFEFKTSSVHVAWANGKARYYATMHIYENTGDNRIPGFAEKGVIMGEWDIDGECSCN